MGGEPTIATGPRDAATRFAAVGSSLVVREWRGSGPAFLHVHHEDDEAWHVLEGRMRFRFADRTVDVEAGGTVFVPAGVAHAYEAIDARYLILLTPRLDALIAELQRVRDVTQHDEIYRRHASALVEAES